MKTLILIRHAKSDWPANTEDFQRPLADKGRKDARKMAVHLKGNNINIDYFLASPAKRTVETCQIFIEEYQKFFDKNDKLYHPSEDNFLSVIFSLNDKFQSAALFSHNNGISEFASSLTGNFIDFPTGAVAIFNVDCENWSEFEMADKNLFRFYKPKSL